MGFKLEQPTSKLPTDHFSSYLFEHFPNKVNVSELPAMYQEVKI